MGRVSGPELDSQVSCNRMAHFVRKGCWSVAAQTSGDVGVTPSIVDPRTKKELKKKNTHPTGFRPNSTATSRYQTVGTKATSGGKEEST
jgi:hypothetical protein